ncbi:MAG: hypothetical protein KFH98_00550 [Gemmatimonadetes bacterium]|nr:hypothetical protein [Gemmatimonadota bacterium]
MNPERGRAVRTRIVRWLAPVLVTAVMTVGIGWLARAPYQPPGSDSATLRLSWRLRAPVAETCRPRTQAELDALPVHMRTPEVCQSRSAAYDLIVQVDARTADTSRVLQGGAKGDRPLFVLKELSLEPGPHHVRVRFASGAGLPAEESVVLALDTVLHMHAGTVDLVTLGPDGRTLIVRQSTQP